MPSPSTRIAQAFGEQTNQPILFGNPATAIGLAIDGSTTFDPATGRFYIWYGGNYYLIGGSSSSAGAIAASGEVEIEDTDEEAIVTNANAELTSLIFAAVTDSTQPNMTFGVGVIRADGTFTLQLSGPPGAGESVTVAWLIINPA